VPDLSSTAINFMNQIQDSNAESVCLWTAPEKDGDNDGRIENSDLYAYCER